MQKVYINDVDIYSTYGAQLIRGAYEALLMPAPSKQYINSESRNQHGTRMIANSDTARLQSRELTLSVLIAGTSQSDYLTKFRSFIDAITQGEFRLKVTALGTTFHLVYSSCTKYGHYGMKKGIFALRLVEPNPKDREYNNE